MEKIVFGYPIDAEILREIAASVSREFENEMQDVFHLGESKTILSWADRFKYNCDVIRSRANPDESVAFRFQPDKRTGLHYMAMVPVDDGQIGIVYSLDDQPLKMRLYHMTTRLMIRTHLDRTKAILDARRRLLDLGKRYVKQTRELEHAEQARTSLEERVRQLNEELETVTRTRDVQDYPELLRLARAYENALAALRREFAILLKINGELINEIQEINATAIPKLAEYETTIHELHARIAQLETARRAEEAALAEARENEVRLKKAQARIGALQDELSRTRADIAAQIKNLEKLRGDQAITDLQRRLSAAEEEGARAKQAAGRMTEGTLAMKAKLAEEEHRTMKFDLLLRLVSEISNISSKYRELGFQPVEALETIRGRLSKL